MTERTKITNDSLTVTLTPEPGKGVSLERFVAALRASATLLETLNPSSEPWLYGGGRVDADGTVTFMAEPRQPSEDQA